MATLVAWCVSERGRIEPYFQKFHMQEMLMSMDGAVRTVSVILRICFHRQNVITVRVLGEMVHQEGHCLGTAAVKCMVDRDMNRI
jgi:hypothetical protein